MNTDEQTPEVAEQDEPTERVIGHYHRGKLERLGWTETRDEYGNSSWSRLSPASGDPIVVTIRFDGSVSWAGPLGRLSTAELRAFAGVADSERKTEAGEPLPERPLLALSDEQRALAENLAQRFAAVGIACTSDEAQLIVTLADLGRQTIDRNEAEGEDRAIKLRTKATTVLCSGEGRASQICLAVLAKLTVRQHVSGYANDVNLRALDIIDTVLHVLAVLAPDKKKLRHPHG
jgi:hypothetical protein